jgi:hypothetical protein
MTTRLVVSGLVALLLWPAPPASALTAQLARKCRDMAIKAHPPVVAGSRKGTAEAEREYFGKCVASNGSMPGQPGQQEPTTVGRGQGQQEPSTVGRGRGRQEPSTVGRGRSPDK